MHRSTRGSEEPPLLPSLLWSPRALRLHASRRSGARSAVVAALLAPFLVLTVLIVLVVLIGGIGVAPVGAEGGDGAVDPAAQKQQNEARQKEVDGQIDTLQESDDQLKAELDKLDVSAHQQQAKAETARADLQTAHAQLDLLSRQLVDAKQLAEQARRDAADRAVAAYMRPDRETATQVLAAKDPQQLAKMHELVTDVTKYNHAVMIDRVAAENDLRSKQAELQEVRDRADHLSADADAAVAATAAVHDRQVAVRAELDKRIAGLQDESKSLEAQEARLSSLLAARTQEVAAHPEAEEVPEPPTTPAPATTAPTTTRPSPSSTTRPGGPTTVAPTSTSKPTTTSTPPTTKKPTGGVRLMWPVVGPVTSPFGARWGVMHKGIDIGVGMGTPIHAAAAGTVFFAGVIDGYGNCILIDHGKGMVTLYAHQSKLIAAQGSYVTGGTTIGLVGSTGHSTGPHLHFEVRINGVAVDPLGYLP